jgi:hypothetical protein
MRFFFVFIRGIFFAFSASTPATLRVAMRAGLSQLAAP